MFWAAQAVTLEGPVTPIPLLQQWGVSRRWEVSWAAMPRRGLKSAAWDARFSAFCQFFQYIYNSFVFFFNPFRIGFECCCCTLWCLRFHRVPDSSVGNKHACLMTVLGTNMSLYALLVTDYFVAISQLTWVWKIKMGKELCHSFTVDGEPITLLFPIAFYLHVRD